MTGTPLPCSIAILAFATALSAADEKEKNKDSLVVAEIKVGNVVLRNLEMPHGETPLADLGVWSPSGEHFFTFSSRQKRIYRIRFDKDKRDFIKDGDADVGVSISQLAMSREGLVLATSSPPQSILVVDPMTFKIKHRIDTRSPTISGKPLGVHPDLSFAVFGGSHYLMMFDLKEGKLLSENIIKEKPSGPALFRFRNLLLSADGKSLYSSGADNDYRIHRFKIDGPRITLVESIDPAKDDNPVASLTLTPDGKRLVHLVATTRKKETSIIFYPSDDLSKPAFQMEGRFPVVAFDGKGALYTVQSGKQSLTVYPPPLDRKPDPSRIPWLHDEGTSSIFPHPKGDGFLTVVRQGRAGSFKHLVFHADTPR